MTDEKAADLRPGEKIGARGRPVPLSERERKFRKDWTKDDCTKHLREMQERDPDTFISRNFFRANSEISDATWNQFFGTFEEFRKGAGLQLSRHAHSIERHIARHASFDLIDEMSEGKRNYAGLYLKPNRHRFKTLLACSDIHDLDCDPFWRRVFIDAVERIKPDVICINGDLFDLPEFSKYNQDPRDWKPMQRVDWCRDFLRDCRIASPDSQIDLIEGNHEFRLFRHLAEQTPALKVILSELHGLDIPGLFKLHDFEVNFIGQADLKAWTEKDIRAELRRNYKVYWDSVLACHYPSRRNLRIPGFGGHHHKHECWPFHNPIYGACEFHQMGAGHCRAADFTDGEAWHLGFMGVHVDTAKRQSVFEYIQLQDHAVVGGEFYTRTKAEVMA